MMKLSLTIVALLGVTALAARENLRAGAVNPPAVEAKAAAPVAKEEDVGKLEAHLEQVVKGLTGIVAAQKAKDPEAKFAKIVEPFVQSVSAVLKQVKTDSNLTNAEKATMLHDAQASVSGLVKDMAKRQQALSQESDADKESLLIGILMARKGRPEAEQMEVLKSDDFKNLTIVKFVLAHRDTKMGLAEQVAAKLDNKNMTKAVMSKAQATKAVVDRLQSQVDKMEKNLKDKEESHKKRMDKFKHAQAEDEKKAASLKGADEKKKEKRHEMIAKRVVKKSERDYQKWHAATVKDLATMKTAVAAIEKGDLSALGKARDALTASFKRMQASQGSFLHFLQFSEYTTAAKDGACPYCKAQCLEKCHNGGESFMNCMTSCADVGN